MTTLKVKFYLNISGVREERAGNGDVDIAAAPKTRQAAGGTS